MAKYIDKDDIVDMLRRWGQEASETNSAEADAFEAVAYEVQHFPEADVVPVVHARWETPDGITRELDTCSVCNWANITGAHCNGFNDLRYCPNCGARMDKEAPNDEVH